MFFIFVVDTSASMGQMTVSGLTLLDCAKSAAEHFVKLRARDPASRLDRFLLLCSADGPGCIRAGWQDSYPVFLNSLKNLRAEGTTNLGAALSVAFELLNLATHQTGNDKLGCGREPWSIDPALIILITDGSKMTTPAGQIQDQIIVTLPKTQGFELTREPFRWDQRVHTLVLRMPGAGLATANLAEPSSSHMSRATGGRTFEAGSVKEMLSRVASMYPIQPGCVVEFEPLSTQVVPTPTEMLVRGHHIIVRKKSTGLWPIPETYWPDPSLKKLPARSAIPTLAFVPVEATAQCPRDFPADKYEVVPCTPQRTPVGTRMAGSYHVFVSTGPRGPRQPPCGFVRFSQTNKAIELTLLPYNFPRLWPIIEELQVTKARSLSAAMRVEFDNYLRELPFYYWRPLAEAFRVMGLPPLVPEQCTNGLPMQIFAYIKSTREAAKADLDRLTSAVMTARSTAAAASLSLGLKDRKSVV